MALINLINTIFLIAFASFYLPDNSLSLPRFKRRLQRYQQRYEKISDTTLLLL
ncbi:hypothetical protein EV200_102106 [Pedobacter psychrotolerans]|uniref:Uncharacterized protein n=1 Tax=Pedobacter psychrotolerans TaxID=1843235 RepID=A0A4R2HIF0_9SPHI|nr:hypothetical protein [Pedobacter psychrotolerans]TCO28689.1 hypothetical protein EV200_102106 [Pedobacter psychrotolerans]